MPLWHGKVATASGVMCDCGIVRVSGQVREETLSDSTAVANHTPLNDASEGDVADWTIEQLLKPAQSSISNRFHDLLASYAMQHPDWRQSIRQPRGQFGFSRRRPGTSQSARHRIAIGCIPHSGGLRRSVSRSAGVAVSRPGTRLHGILVHHFSTPPSYPVPLPDCPQGKASVNSRSPRDRASWAIPACGPSFAPASHSSSFDHRRRPEALRTAIATAFF